MAEWKKLVAESAADTITQDTTGNAATATSAGRLTTGRTIGLSGDLSGSAGFDGSANISIAASIGADTVGFSEIDAGTALPAADHILFYNSSSGLSWETPSTVTVGTATQATALATARTITLSGDLSGSTSFDGSANVSISAQIAANVVGASELNVTGNGTAGQVLASDGDGSFSWTSAGAAGTVTSVTAGNGMSFTAITTTGAVTMGTPGALSASTTNAVTASSHTHSVTASSNPGAAASLLETNASGELTLAGLTVTGDLEIQGSLTSIDTTNLQVTDSVIMLNALADSTDYADLDSAIILGNTTQAHGGKIINTDGYIAFTELHATDMPSGTLPAGVATAGTYKQIRAKDVVLATQGALPTGAAGLLAFDGTDLWIYV